jgi:L-asparaginase II
MLLDVSEEAEAEHARAQLIAQCDTVCKQGKAAPVRRDLMQRMRALQAQYDAAETAATDFVLIGTLGMQLQELEEESAQLPLSEEDYLTLTDRHAALVQRVTDACRALKAPGYFAELDKLATQLEALRALDVSGPPVPSGGM